MLADDERKLRELREWVVRAEDDYAAVTLLLKSDSTPPTRVICYHAQQCVEKYLKAALFSQRINFQWTHELERLVRRLPQSILLRLSLEEQRTLTRYATVTRYPGDYTPITLTEARRAVAIARRVRREVRRWLPKAALKR